MSSRREDDDARHRSNSQEWGEEGFQIDDSRSCSSQKSDAGYLSSGAMSDGAKDPHFNSSMRSIGSVGSQESGRYYFRVHAATAHIMNGETRFPTAMSYASDAQRSDVATVCSGSGVEDIEVESVLSQEDQTNIAAAATRSSPAPADKTFRRGGGGVTRVVEFASEPRTSVVPRLGAVAPGAVGDGDSSLAIHNMGPPLSRALLLQKADGASSSQAGSVKSFGSNPGSEGAHGHHLDYDCSGSLDVEAHSVNSHGDASHTDSDHKKDHIDSKPPSQASSVKSFGSQAESDTGAHVDMDDCGGSLDVETHSVGTRSIHSQDGVPSMEATEAASKPEPTSEESKANPLLINDLIENGRRSPGGTIYKGRGARRYQGRYMHLPLKRFHQNGVHLDSVDEHNATRDSKEGDAVNGFTNGYINGINGFHVNRADWGDHIIDRDKRFRCRSRSRSRSPQPESQLDGDSRKHRARSSGPKYRQRSER